MKQYLAIYHVWEVKPFDHGFLNSGYTQSDSSTQSLYKFEAQNNSTAKKMASKHKTKLHRLNSTFLGKIKIRLSSGKPIRRPELEELLEVTPVPIK